MGVRYAGGVDFWRFRTPSFPSCMTKKRCGQWVITTRSELQKVLFLAPSVCVFLFVYEISREQLKGFASNSHRRRVWSLAGTSLKVKVKDQGHQEQTMAFFDPLAACVRFLFGKTSLASTFPCFSAVL